MIRTLLTSTALALVLATGAMAQTATSDGSNDMLSKGYTVVDTDGLASKLIGFPVYASEASDAEHYGEINDLVIGQSGEVSAVIIGVGGFLGVGEKNVAVDYDDLKWVTAQDNTERIVLATTKEALNAAPAVELANDEPMATAAVPAADQPAANNAPVDATATGTVSTAPAAEPNASPAMDPFDPAKSTAVDFATLTADDLKGTNVYGPDNQHIGTIGDFVLAEDGKAIDAVIIDFGGFLGIGTKPVAIAYDALPFYVDEAGRRSLVLNLTREQMEAAPAFNKDTYAAERETQRITIAS
jgi:sporulation protein YlmC with PRC-barrel domain